MESFQPIAPVKGATLVEEEFREEEKVKSAISDSDKKKIEDKCDECIKWLDANQMAEKDEYEDKQKEVEQVCNPIIQNLYSGAGGKIHL